MTGAAQNRRHFPLDVGDRGPAIYLQNQYGEHVSPNHDTFAGSPSVVAFYPSLADPVAAGELRRFQHRYEAIAGRDATLFVVSRDPVDGLARLCARESYPFFLLSDEDGATFARHSLLQPDGSCVAACYLFDPNYRVAAWMELDGPDGAAERIVSALEEGFAAPACLRLKDHPPILILPRFVNDRFCHHLLALWRREREREIRGSGGPTGLSDLVVRDDSQGRIRQYAVQNKEILGYLDFAINRRLMPEMMKAFQTKISQREGFVMTCYAREDGGFLGPHRDNHHERSRHRRFTLSVVLNGGAYEGGALRFKEYGAHHYDFDPGTGVVWSAGLLHEVLPVTQGQRFVTGTHLFGN